LVIVVALMLVVPLASIAAAILLRHQVLSSQLVMTWYVFWAVGVRLSLAGVRQIVQPRYTAQVILGITGKDALLLVRELGFANCALGSVAFASLFIPAWRLPAAIAAAIFYALAGINHVVHRQRSSNQTIAMASDIFAALVLLVSAAHP
jgi:hypothetical protein